MQRYILSRLVQCVLILFGVLCIVFFMLQVTGDPVALMVSRNTSPEQIEQLREEMGFNRPMIVQFADFAAHAVRGDFGMSIRHKQPAMKLIMDRLPATVELATVALLMSMIMGITLGLLGGSNPGSIWDTIARGAGLIGQTIPNFWLALILIILFAVDLGWFPAFGRDTWHFLGIRLPTRSVILPAFSLGLFTMGQLVRFTRSAVMEIRNEDFVRTAYSKGLHDKRIYIKHILRNASIPLISILAGPRQPFGGSHRQPGLCTGSSHRLFHRCGGCHPQPADGYRLRAGRPPHQVWRLIICSLHRKIFQQARVLTKKKIAACGLNSYLSANSWLVTVPAHSD